MENNLKTHQKDIKVSCLWVVRAENAFKQSQFRFSVQIHNGYFHETVVIHPFFCFFLYNSGAVAMSGWMWMLFRFKLEKKLLCSSSSQF